jgi:hypothetical protein
MSIPKLPDVAMEELEASRRLVGDDLELIAHPRDVRRRLLALRDDLYRRRLVREWQHLREAFDVLEDAGTERRAEHIGRTG